MPLVLATVPLAVNSYIVTHTPNIIVHVAMKTVSELTETGSKFLRVLGIY